MRRHRGVVLLLGFFLSAPCIAAGGQRVPKSNSIKSGTPTPNLPSVMLRDAQLVKYPGIDDPKRGFRGVVDCNSPAHWDGDTFYLFNSYHRPWRFAGSDLFHLGKPSPVNLGEVNSRRLIWIESTWKDVDGTLYAWYHHEPTGVCRSNSHLPTAPRIGALSSKDNGENWEDMGFVLDAPPGSLRCDTLSPWDAGGEGDFSVILDSESRFFYFFFSSYVREFPEQGVGVARMRYADRKSPSGKVWKWFKGNWSEPGIGGRITPIFPAKIDWHRKDADLFWGPSIHWNTYLNMFVMVLNHAVDSAMTQEGIYITFNRSIADPTQWTPPKKILDRERIAAAMEGAVGPAPIVQNGWYPQVTGLEKGETDKLAGRRARLFIAGLSRLEIIFLRPGEKLE